MITRRDVGVIGTSQLVLWGISYYLIGIFGPAIERDAQWSQAFIYGGFSIALLVMGIASPWAGKAIDRFGGARIMAGGSALIAVACVLLAASTSREGYLGSWVVMGIAMRLTLYDAAFATLARLGGDGSRRAMSQVTLYGGFASTVFWPIGAYLQGAVGWRGGVLVYGVIALFMAVMLRGLHRGDDGRGSEDASRGSAVVADGRGGLPEALLYATIMALVAFINSAMSSHMIVLLTGLGMGLASAVFVSTLRGVGQTVGRLCEMLFGKRIHPLQLSLLATMLMPLGFASLGAWGGNVEAGISFAIFYGVGNGLSTITRGSVPLVLFGSARYGSLVGRLLVPSFILSAAAPLVVAEYSARVGPEGAVWLLLAVSGMAFACSAVLVAVARGRGIRL